MNTHDHFDMIIRRGTVVDGTGRPRIEMDVAIKGGVIAAVGDIQGAATEEFDASGLLVTPGFVDIHTHYDGQAIWDSRLLPSSWHGVTTVVMGNCGVGFAPVRQEHRQKLLELMEGIEDIPHPCLSEGLDWQWESFSDYLDAIERRPHDVDICALLPHAALRVYVMGERALRLEEATDEDIARMRQLCRQAMHSGALGFSTSRAHGHRTLKGDHTPTLRSAERELAEIVLGMADAGHGVFQAIADWDESDPESEFRLFERIVAETGRPSLLSVTQRHYQPTVWRDIMKLIQGSAKAGLPIKPVVSPRPIGIIFGLDGTQNPFAGTRTYQSIASLPLAERVARMRDPECRRRILADDPFEVNTFVLLSRVHYEQVFRLGDPPNYNPPAGDAVAAIATREGRPPREVMYDMLLEDNGHALLFTPITNYADHTLDACQQMVADRNSLFGLGDAGAHVGFITDASFPTYLLTHWARNGNGDGFSLEELISRQTCDNARAFGLCDRGTVEPRMKADLNVIDYDNLAIEAPRMVRDLPAGGNRLLQTARGYELTMVSGAVTYRGGKATGLLPGRVVRGPQGAPLSKK